MVRLGHLDRSFAAGLAAIAGYVDAVGFLKAGGFFVSFMSGNSTRLAVGLVRGTPSATVAAGLIAAFVIGVMLGTFANGLSAGRPRLVLLCVAALLGIAAIADHVGLGAISVFVAAAAMGAENATFSRDGDVQIGLTYMTGTLVKFAQRLALALQGRKDTGWLSFLLLWVGLVCGGVLGALAYQQFGFPAVWPIVAILAALSFYTPASFET